MTAAVRKAPEPPLGIIGALASGFETVNARLELILLPLALDLFLWLGPHLSIRPLAEQFADLLRAPAGSDAATLQTFSQLRDALAAYGASFNLLSVVSTFPVGVPSLMAGRAPIAHPTGPALWWPVDNALVYLLLFSVFVLVGLFLGALYFGGIAQQVRDARLSLRLLLRQVWGDWARLTALAVIAAMGLLFFGVPAALVIALATLISPIAGSVVSLIGSTMALWVVFYASFTLHGIILQRRGLFGALWDSLRLVHTSLPNTAGLYGTLILLGLGLGAVWNLPSDNSWLMLIGVGGHALVSTALVAATFAFYKDRYRWWVEVRQAYQAQAKAGKSGVNRSTKA